METPPGKTLASPGTRTVTVAKDEKSRSVSPSWLQSRASSTASTGQLERNTLKSPGMVPESQQILKNDLELIKAQLSAQTKAFEALSHSITLLEQESRKQEGRIMQLEEEVKFATHSPGGAMLEGLIQNRIQELWRAVAREVEGLHGTMDQKKISVESLSKEILESKKFLWEELEAVQAELRCIHQKLKDQERDITRNLVNIKKMQENQMRCTKFLTLLKDRVAGDSSDTAGKQPGKNEENDSRSAIDTLCDSLTNCSMWKDKRGALRTKSIG